MISHEDSQIPILDRTDISANMKRKTNEMNEHTEKEKK